ncbi:hypothetical protein C4K39_2642 [Pseudomonas sessilinigenes]|nr:hypothetical protein C4K39_2642 [Pseudomonas sessilinigenes]
MGSPHSGRLPLARSAPEYPTDKPPSKQRGRDCPGFQGRCIDSAEEWHLRCGNLVRFCRKASGPALSLVLRFFRRCRSARQSGLSPHPW